MSGVLGWGWDATNEVWRPIKVSATGALYIVETVDALDDIGDVNVPAPGDGEVLAWDDGAGEWVALAIPAAAWADITGKPTAPSLEELAAEHEDDGTHEDITPTSCTLEYTHPGVVQCDAITTCDKHTKVLHDALGLSHDSLADVSKDDHHSASKIVDADNDTKVDVEEAGDEDIVRMDVAGVEAFHLSAVGILDLVKQPAASAYLSAAQNLKTSTFTKLFLDTESYDVQNEFDPTNGAGTAEAGTAGTTLHDDGVFAGAAIGDAIWNTTDDTYTKIDSVTSNDEVECTDAIFAVGETFKWFRAKYTATQAGRYLIIGRCSWSAAQVVADKTIAAAIYKNGANLEQAAIHIAYGAGATVAQLSIASLAANDYIELYGWHNFGATKAITSGAIYTSMTIFKLS